MERSLVQAALAGYLVYSVSHLAFHATHLAGLPTTDATLLLTGLALLPAFALALLLIAGRRRQEPRNTPSQAGDETAWCEPEDPVRATSSVPSTRARCRGRAGAPRAERR